MAEGWTYVLCHQDFRYELKDGEQTVGRSRTSDVAVNDPSVSRKHVILKPKDGIVLLTDLGSSNGTFVNGKKVQGEAVLEDGDVLRLGDAELRVEVVHADAMQTVRMPIGGSRPQPGEATFFLAAESMKLAEALEAQAAAAPAAPGSHMPGPLSTQRLQLDPSAPGSPFAAPPARPSNETQRLPPGFLPPPAVSPNETQRFDSASFSPPAAPGPSLGTQRIELPPSGPPAPAVAAPAPAAGAQTIRLSPADLRQLENGPPPAVDPYPSFEAPADAYPSFEAPPAFEPWTPEAPETSFADIVEPSSPALPRPDAGAYHPPAPSFEAPPSFDSPPSFDPPAPAPAFAAPAFAPPAPAPPAYNPPAAPAFQAPPSFAPPTPPAIQPPPSFAPPSFAPPSFAPPPPAPPAFSPPAPPAFPPPPSFDRPTPPAAPPGPPAFTPPSFDRPTAPAAPPPAMPADLRGLRQPSSAGELLPSLDDLDAAIGAPGIQDPLATPRGTGAVPMPAGVPFGAPCAGFGIRFLAYLLDTLWIVGLQTAAWIFSNGDPLFASAASLVSTAVVFIGWSIWGTTPGKRVVGLYLHGEDGQTGIGFLRAFIRMVGYLLSAALFGAGFLMILFTKDHRGLHDRIARTWVYRHSS